MCRFLTAFFLLQTLSFSTWADIAVGTVVQTVHFEQSATRNEQHHGLYLRYNSWSAGSFINSLGNDSEFIIYDFAPLNEDDIKVNFFIGTANNYDSLSKSFDGYIPLAGYKASYGIVRVIVSPVGLTFGLEVPLN